MRYKVGEQVVVKSWEELLDIGEVDLVGDIRLSDIFFVREMAEYCDKIVTISEVEEGGQLYCIEEDCNFYSWTDEMFKPLPFQIGDIVICSVPGEYWVTNEFSLCEVIALNLGKFSTMTVKLIYTSDERVKHFMNETFEVDTNCFEILDFCKQSKEKRRIQRELEYLQSQED